MIERILLVAGRELGATLLTRAFIVMVLSPLIAILCVPLVIVPITLIEGAMKGDPTAEAPAKPRVEVYQAGPLFETLEARALDHWELAQGEGDSADEKSFLAGEAVARVVLEPASAGRYTVYIRGEAQDPPSAQTRRLMRTVDGALEEARLVEAGLSAEAVQQALSVEGQVEYIAPPSIDLVKQIQDMQGVILPAAVLFLMFSALSMAGQGLLTSTLEEKSTRVAEVLLGAVSPVELLTGKVVGQLGVSVIFALMWSTPTLLALGLYASVTLGPLQLLYLLVLVSLASLSWAAVMGGIGSAVNDLTEAQHILGPLFMVMMIFFIPAIAAIASPSDPAIVAFSLVPPTSAPVMAARIASQASPPHWQVWLSLLTSGAFALFLLWAAGRLFRVGLLLRSSPPNLRTLVRWIITG